MSTTDLDPTSPTTATSETLARFLAGGPVPRTSGAEAEPVRRAGAAGVRGVERRAALRGGLLGAGRPTGEVVVRETTDADRPALRRLAAVDGGRIPRAPLLIAEQGGVVTAAIGVLDRHVIADPAVDAQVAVDRLQAHAAERRGRERRRRWAGRLRRG